MNGNPTDTDARSLTANRVYSVRELAEHLGMGTRPVYAAIRSGQLKAAPVNGRGDMRITGAWALEFLEKQQRTLQVGAEQVA